MPQKRRNEVDRPRNFFSQTSTDVARFGRGKATGSFKEEMAKLRESNDLMEMRSTSAGGFYSSMRDGSDGWVGGRRNLMTGLNPDTMSN